MVFDHSKSHHTRHHRREVLPYQRRWVVSVPTPLDGIIQTFHTRSSFTQTFRPGGVVKRTSRFAIRSLNSNFEFQIILKEVTQNLIKSWTSDKIRKDRMEILTFSYKERITWQPKPFVHRNYSVHESTSFFLTEFFFT